MNGLCNRIYCVCCEYYNCDCSGKSYRVASYEELSRRKTDPRFFSYKKQISKAISSNYSLSGLINLKDANDFLDSVSYLDGVEYDPNDPDIVSKYIRAANLSIAYLKAHGGLKSTESNGTNSIKRAIYIINACIMGGNYKLVAVDQKEDESEETEKERFVPVCTDEEEGFRIADNSFIFTFDLSKSSKLYKSVTDMMNYYFKNLRWEYERFNRMILDTKFIADTYWNSNPDDTVVNSWAPMLRSISLDTNEYEIRFRYDQLTYQFQFNKDSYSITIIFRRVNNLPIDDIMNLAYGRTAVEDIIKKNETDTEENINDEGNIGLVTIGPKLATTMKYSYFASDEILKENEPEVYQYFVKIMKSYNKSKDIYVNDLEKFILGMKHFIKEEPVYRLNPRISYINFEVSNDHDVIFQFFCPELNNYVSIVVRIYMNDTWRDIL